MPLDIQVGLVFLGGLIILGLLLCRIYEERGIGEAKRVAFNTVVHFVLEGLLPLAALVLMTIKSHTVNGDSFFLASTMYAVSLVNAIKDPTGPIVAVASLAFMGTVYFSSPLQPDGTIGAQKASSLHEFMQSCSTSAILTSAVYLILFVLSFRLWLAYSTYSIPGSESHWLVKIFEDAYRKRQEKIEEAASRLEEEAREVAAKHATLGTEQVDEGTSIRVNQTQKEGRK